MVTITVQSQARFPGNSTEHFPVYIVGWFLVTNPETSRRIVTASRGFPYLYLEDVWVTGLLREEMGMEVEDMIIMGIFMMLIMMNIIITILEVVDLYGMRADTNEQLLATKAVQSSHAWVSIYFFLG